MDRVQILLTGVVLAAFMIVGVATVAFMHQQTAPVIADQARAALGLRLAAVLPSGYTNTPATEMRVLPSDPLLGGKVANLYVARKDGKVSALALTTVAPNGYSGAIQLLIGITRDGVISGVRVVTHRETPGLGDLIEEAKSNWIYAFNGKSLADPSGKGWGVKKDGGIFDQFTGATITPRAVVQAVHHALQYFEQHRAELLEEATP
jgi:electron transport complex protein RnfG